MPGHERGEFWPPEKSAPSLDLRARAATQAVIAVAIVLLAVWVARDFLVALTWAAVIAITCWPIYLCFERLVGHRSRSLAPLLFTLVTGLVLLVPIIVTVHQLAQGSEAFVRAINRLRESGIAVPAWLAQLPVAGEYLDLWWRANLSNPDVLVEWFRGVNVENLTAWTGTLGGALLHRLLLFAITLVALFLILRDGAWLADRALVTADRLLGDRGAHLVGKIAGATRNHRERDDSGCDRKRRCHRDCVHPDGRAASGAVHVSDHGVGDGATWSVAGAWCRRPDLGASRRHIVGAGCTVCLWRGDVADR